MRRPKISLLEYILVAALIATLGYILISALHL